MSIQMVPNVLVYSFFCAISPCESGPPHYGEQHFDAVSGKKADS